ncbi:MAG: hydrolase TatD [Candidatus Tyloplasma litorale]|nr:MAG: hydrolase TatD [Mycoplasmatales bacterium]
MKTIDTHAHILKKSYPDNLQEVIENTNKENLIAINIAYDLISSKEVIDIFKNNKNILPTIGIHPSDSKGWNNNYILELEKLINKNIIAIGEIGLDYHYEHYDKEEQKKAFKDQINLAIKHNLPIVVHTRDSLEDCYEIVKNYPNHKFLFHSWSGDPEITKKFLNLSKNFYFSFNGIFTFKNALIQKASIREIPLDRIMFETDCPWLTPVPFRGQINYPWRVKEVIKFTSKFLNMTYEELNLNNNKVAIEFYGIKKGILN